MSASTGGEATRRVKREEAAARQERLVELVDAVAIRRVLSGCPSAVEALTRLEREVVISIVDLLGADLEITAAGLGITRNSLDWAVRRQRRRVAELTRDLMAAVMLRPAAELVEAVAADDGGLSSGSSRRCRVSSSRRSLSCWPPLSRIRRCCLMRAVSAPEYPWTITRACRRLPAVLSTFPQRETAR